LFSIRTDKKCVIFKDIFPGLSRTLIFDFQDFPGPMCFSRTFQVLEFSRKIIQDFPGGVGTLNLSFACNSELYRLSKKLVTNTAQH